MEKIILSKHLSVIRVVIHNLLANLRSDPRNPFATAVRPV